MSDISKLYPDAICLEGLDPFGNEIDNDLQGLEQDIYHILLEALGDNLDDPSRGVGIFDLLSGKIANVYAAASDINLQLLRDDRISDARTSLVQSTASDGTASYRIDIEVEAMARILNFSFTLDSSGLIPTGAA